MCSVAGPGVDPWSTAAGDGDKAGHNEENISAAGPT